MNERIKLNARRVQHTQPSTNVRLQQPSTSIDSAKTETQCNICSLRDLSCQFLFSFAVCLKTLRQAAEQHRRIEIFRNHIYDTIEHLTSRLATVKPLCIRWMSFVFFENPRQNCRRSLDGSLVDQKCINVNFQREKGRKKGNDK